MGYVKLYEEFLSEVSVETEEVKTEDLISEDEFKSLITKLVKHELKEELDPEEEAKEISMEGLTKEELEKVNKFIETLWANEEPSKNEVENSEDVNEILGFSKEEKEARAAKKRKDALDSIMRHSTQHKNYNEWLKKDPAIAEKMITFVMNNPGIKYFDYNKEKGDFAQIGKFKVASGEGTTGK